MSYKIKFCILIKRRQLINFYINALFQYRLMIQGLENLLETAEDTTTEAAYFPVTLGRYTLLITFISVVTQPLLNLAWVIV